MIIWHSKAIIILMYHGHGSENLKRPPTYHRYTFSKQYSRLNISFAIKNPRTSSSFQQSPPYSPPYTPEVSPPSTREQRITALVNASQRPHPYNSTHSVNLYPSKCNNKPAEVQFKKQAKHVVNAFPKRKQKSGEQQLLKLLMKFNRHPSQDMSPPARKVPLFDMGPDTKSAMIPKLKARTRYNWSKERYCANRDK